MNIEEFKVGLYSSKNFTKINKIVKQIKQDDEKKDQKNSDSNN
ncbi:hypothetical protein [Paenibacillus taichungensis]